MCDKHITMRYLNEVGFKMNMNANDRKLITRKGNDTKMILASAWLLLHGITDLLDQSTNGVIWINQKFMQDYTGCNSRQQNNSLLNQLGDIIEAEYHASWYDETIDDRRLFGYVVKFTETGKDRLENPEKYYERRLLNAKK